MPDPLLAAVNSNDPAQAALSPVNAGIPMAPMGMAPLDPKMLDSMRRQQVFDTLTDAGLGLIQAGAPSRIPNDGWTAFGALAGGAAQGARNSYDRTTARYKDMASMAMATQQMRRIQLMNDLLTGNGGASQPQNASGQPGAQPAAQPAAPQVGAQPHPFNIGNVRPPGATQGFMQPASFNDGVQLAVNTAKAYPAQYNNGQPMTLPQIGQHWAPAGDGNNDPAKWAANVGQIGGLDPNQPLDMNDPATAASFARGVHGQEWGADKALPVQAYGAALSAPPGAASPAAPGMPAPLQIPDRLNKMLLFPEAQKFAQAQIDQLLTAKKQEWDRYHANQKLIEMGRQNANASVVIGPDGQPMPNRAVISAAAQKAAEEEKAKAAAHVSSVLPDGWQGMSGDELRGKMNPLVMASIDQLGQYKKFPSQIPARLGGSNGPTKDELMSVVPSFYPEWSPVAASNRESFVNYYQPDKDGGKTLASISNGAQHVGDAADAFNQMRNGQMPLANRLFNALKTQNGWGKEVGFDTVKEAIGTELAKVIAGASDNSVSERQAHREIMDSANSPEQMQEVFGRYAGMIGKRLNTVYGQAKNVGLDKDWVNAHVGEDGMKALAALPTAIRLPRAPQQAAPPAPGAPQGGGIPAPPSGFRVLQ